MNSEQLEKYVVSVVENDKILSKIELIRHLNPILIERIVRVLPLSSFILVLKDRILLKVTANYGVAKKKTIHEVGDVAFDSLNSAIIIYTDKSVDEFENIGKVKEGLENLYKLKTGNLVLLKL
ncbi:MAG TPA: hypothetical protein VKU94_02125 [Geobacterales bacterium]|nr:hypothetical protein [Geobacterales bacterium]